ncbi:hypothetical protein G6F22_009434 [Rhizopus arrhizus]|nr:hypothetical protein G6F22_009434 [Rhizopus arrhizus]
MLAHGGAPVGDAGDLGCRSAVRHHGDGGHVQAVGGPRHALGVVAGRGADHRPGVAALAAGQQRVQCAAYLVGTGALQVFQLQPGTEALGMVQRRGRQEAAQSGLRGQYVGDAYVADIAFLAGISGRHGPPAGCGRPPHAGTGGEEDASVPAPWSLRSSRSAGTAFPPGAGHPPPAAGASGHRRRPPARR